MLLYRKNCKISRRVVANICEICKKSPCDARCPNAPEPPLVHECESCGAEIREGDTYYNLDGVPYCEECIEAAREEAEPTYGFE